MPKDKTSRGSSSGPYGTRQQRAQVFDDNAISTKLRELNTHWRDFVRKKISRLKNANADDLIAQSIIPANSRNCAAVFVPALGLPLVAMNSWNTQLVEGGGATGHAVIYAQGLYQKVQYTDAQLHAEMKILEYQFNAGPYYGNNYYIGISKPCCLRCAVVMKIQGIRTRGSSGGLWAAGWKIPNFVSTNNARLNAFMGNTVFNWYSNLAKTDKETFIRRVQTLKE